MKKKSAKPEASILFNEAERAIYIDFEGFENASPSLLGILIGDSFEQVVMDHRLHSAAKAKRGLPKTMKSSRIHRNFRRSRSLRPARNRIFRRVRRMPNRIWSNHIKNSTYHS